VVCVERSDHVGAGVARWRGACSSMARVQGRNAHCGFEAVQFAHVRDRRRVLGSCAGAWPVHVRILDAALFLGSVRGYSALQIGHTMFVQGAVMFLTAPLIGRKSGATLPRHAAARRDWVLCSLALSCWVQAHLTAEAGFWQLAWPQVLRALGLMMTFNSVMQPALQSLPPHLVHSGAGLVQHDPQSWAARSGLRRWRPCRRIRTPCIARSFIRRRQSQQPARRRHDRRRAGLSGASGRRLIRSGRR
jgi:hypothetical protein